MYKQIDTDSDMIGLTGLVNQEMLKKIQIVSTA